jgi:hypothetical protein
VPRIVLARRCSRRPKANVVPLLALYQVDVLKVRCGGLHGIKHVPQHGDVTFYVFHTSLAELCPRRIEEMSYALRGSERTCTTYLVQEIGTYV